MTRIHKAVLEASKAREEIFSKGKMIGEFLEIEDEILRKIARRHTPLIMRIHLWLWPLKKRWFGNIQCRCQERAAKWSELEKWFRAWIKF